MNRQVKAEEEVISQSMEEEMQLDDHDKQLDNLQDLNEERFREGYQKYQVKLYVEIIEHKHNSLNSVEFFPFFDLKLMINKQGSISFPELIQKLKQQGFQLEGRQVSYYSYDSQLYVNCGIDPIHQDISIPFDEVSNKRLRVRFQATGQSLIHMVMSEEMNEAVNRMKENGDQTSQIDEQIEDAGSSKVCRRTKERRIGYIIDKVVKWREYYNGKKDANGQLQRYTLDEAAKKVGISKKSLDDYLLQIRYGRKFGFNFNEHKNDKVGILRAFVKKQNLNGTKNPKKKSAKKETKTEHK